MILSHFHADHIGNLDKISYSNVYQGRLTYKYTKTGEILENDLYFCDGNMNLHIFPLPSSHAKGSLALEINEKYCFLGDGVYAMQKGEKRLYNAGILKEEIEILKNIKAQHFMLSHRNPFDNSKDSVIRLLDGIYAKRKAESRIFPALWGMRGIKLVVSESMQSIFMYWTLYIYTK